MPFSPSKTEFPVGIRHPSASGTRRHPNPAGLLWKVHIALAYGAEGLHHFTCRTPGPGTVGFEKALVSRSDKRPRTYPDELLPRREWPGCSGFAAAEGNEP